MAENINPAQADTDNKLLRKILLALLNGSGGGGGGGGGAVTMADGANVTQGAKADAQATNATSSWTVVSLLKGLWAQITGVLNQATTLNNQLNTQGYTVPVVQSGPASNFNANVSQATAANLNATVVQTTAANLNANVSSVDGGLVSVGTKGDAIASSAGASWTVISLLKGIYNLLTGTLSTSTVVSGTTSVVGNVGGISTVVQNQPTITSGSAYSAGNVVGGLQSVTAFTSKHTGLLDTIAVIDRSNQSAPFDILIFNANPTLGTYTDHSGIVFNGDDLKLIARIPVATSDYATYNSIAIATLKGLGVVARSTNLFLYVVVVTSGTPTYANTTDLQFSFGVLQD